MAVGFPGFIGRPGFRGGHLHPVRRMLSYEENRISAEETTQYFKLATTEKQASPPRPSKLSQHLSLRDNRPLNSLKTQNISIQNNSPNDIGSNAYRKASSYTKYRSNGLQKGAHHARSLLWSPPQIISSVLKVFQKVLSSGICFNRL